MPIRLEIQQEAQRAVSGAYDIVRRKYVAQLAKHTKRPVIIYASAIYSPRFAHAGGGLSITPNDIQGFMAACKDVPGPNLDLILHSPGGSAEAAEQIVNYLRARFTHIRAIIPQAAMSAATMIACACDEIIMGKHSAIGPIDPQIMLPRAGGSIYLPAQAYLDEFLRAKTDIKADPASAALWIEKLRELPPGFLSKCSTLIVRAQEVVKAWLRDYMKLSDADAAKAAEWLGKADNHKSHGRPISAIQAKEHGLKVTHLEDDAMLQERVLSVYHSLIVTFDGTWCGKLVENNKGRGAYFIFNPPRH